MTMRILLIFMIILLILSIFSIIGLFILKPPPEGTTMYICIFTFFLILLTISITGLPKNFIWQRLLLFSFYPISLISAYLYFKMSEVLYSKIILVAIFLISFLIFI